MKTIIDEKGLVSDIEIAQEMADIEKPFREGMKIKKIFSGKAKVILEGTKLSEKYLEEKTLEILKEEELRLKEEERLALIIKKELETKLIIENITKGKKEGMDAFELSEKLKKEELNKKLNSIFESEGLDGLSNHFGLTIERRDCISAENIINELFRINHFNIFSKLIEKVANTYFTTSYYDDHSLCHLFEKYERTNKTTSFVGNPELYSISAKLIENSINNNGNCLSRVIGPLPIIAFEDILAGKLDNYTFRPESIETVGLERRFKSEYQQDLIDFIGSKTPKEYLEKTVKNILMEEGNKNVIRFIQENIFDENDMTSFLNACSVILDTQNLEALTQKLKEAKIALDSKNASENSDSKEDYVNVICVDVDDTLIVSGSLNESLVDRLKENILSGKNILVFSSGDQEVQTSRLKKLGLDDIFLPVVSKESMKGIKVYRIIDDTKPDVQGLSCIHHYTPDRYRR